MTIFIPPAAVWFVAGAITMLVVLLLVAMWRPYKSTSDEESAPKA